MKLIGWGTQEGFKYWIMMNSFGPLWGENGLFKVAMDGSDNTELGYAIIAPKFQISDAHTKYNSVLVIYMMQLLVKLCSA